MIWIMVETSVPEKLKKGNAFSFPDRPDEQVLSFFYPFLLYLIGFFECGFITKRHNIYQRDVGTMV
jgi:hypothetical protein